MIQILTLHYYYSLMVNSNPLNTLEFHWRRFSSIMWSIIILISFMYIIILVLQYLASWLTYVMHPLPFSIPILSILSRTLIAFHPFSYSNSIPIHPLFTFLSIHQSFLSNSPRLAEGIIH